MATCSWEYGRVWSRFERCVQGRRLQLQVEDLPEPLWSAAVEFMLDDYIREDVWWAAAGTAADPAAVQEYRVLLTSIVQRRLSLGVFLTDSAGDGAARSLVAVNMCVPQKKGVFVEHAPPKSKAGLMSLRMFAEAMKIDAIYCQLGVEEYLMGTGLSVAPQYRGLGLAVQLLEARMSLCSAAGLAATGGIFTSARAQRSAERAGWRCVHAERYDEFAARCGFPIHTHTAYLKIFAVAV